LPKRPVYGKLILLPSSAVDGGISVYAPSAQPQPQRSPARRFVAVFLAAAAIGCLAVGGFNYAVNPLNYYPPKLVRPLAWGDQFEKLDLMRTAPPADVLIIGSSRTMKLSPADVKAVAGKSAFNAGVSSSRPEEWYATLRYAVEGLHWKPQEVVLGIDMETLFYQGEPNEDLLSSSELRRYLPVSLRVGSLWERSKLLVSLDQVELSWKAIKLAQSAGQSPPETSFDPDGYLHYLRMERQVADGSFKLVTQYQVSNYQQRYAGAAGFDPLRRELFEQMLQYAADHGIRVRAFFTPFHPSVLAEMEKLDTFTHVHREMTAYAAELRERFPTAGFFDFTAVSAFGGDPNAFFDGVHYRQENARKLLEHLYHQEG
jgi:hypothetical protein